jgi:hypothetical protein
LSHGVKEERIIFLNLVCASSSLEAWRDWKKVPSGSRSRERLQDIKDDTGASRSVD